MPAATTACCRFCAVISASATLARSAVSSACEVSSARDSSAACSAARSRSVSAPRRPPIGVLDGAQRVVAGLAHGVALLDGLPDGRLRLGDAAFGLLGLRARLPGLALRLLHLGAGLLGLRAGLVGLDPRLLGLSACLVGLGASLLGLVPGGGRVPLGGFLLRLEVGDLGDGLVLHLGGAALGFGDLAFGLDRAAVGLLGLTPRALHLAPRRRRVPLRRLLLRLDGRDLRRGVALRLGDLALAGGEGVADEVGHLAEPLDDVPGLRLGLLGLRRPGGLAGLVGLGHLDRLLGGRHGDVRPAGGVTSHRGPGGARFRDSARTTRSVQLAHCSPRLAARGRVRGAGVHVVCAGPPVDMALASLLARRLVASLTEGTLVRTGETFAQFGV
ncbi:hypothetical protein BJF79_14860 [Actinomadura sp. CNU-125]|nr:hypothetical protein BJF79_14860 [Actinomadura sp. CNU-125]